jgi:small nuclear ribonucleoprotein (snRNP)-like protein
MDFYGMILVKNKDKIWEIKVVGGMKRQGQLKSFEEQLLPKIKETL